MSLGPLIKYELTATCSKCDFTDSKEVETEFVNLTVETRRYIQIVAGKHSGRDHPPDITITTNEGED